MSRPAPPIVLFAFANDRVDKARYLRNLPEEKRRVLEAMAVAEQAGLCEVRDKSNATVVEVLDFFRDARFRNRVAIFHFGGHAGSGVLLFESPEGAARAAHAGGFARFLGEQRGLVLVFLNGCSTQGQVENLLDAGVPAVIATSQDIPDAVATELSNWFYKAIASGVPLGSAFHEAAAAVQTRTGQEAKPWDLYVKPGAEERVERWSLPVAARDPLFGLPALPEMDLPRAPFKHLAQFTRADAHVFFGRGREIRELFEAATLSDAAPIVLLFGVAGAGKSSLLAAGLQPRLEASHDVLYLRRDGKLGLTETLAHALPDWRQREERSGKPLIVILDQAEEAWTRPLEGGGEIEAFASLLRTLFAVRESRPRGRLLLGFRKEWLAEILRLLDAEELPRTRVEVTHLDPNGVREAVAGIASTGRLKRQYRLEIDEELPPLIAVDLLKQQEDTIAPILQILLTKMWGHATAESP
ncbi:MAG TPA: CHAT domain-containing protein, partial [Thermoanaerobaculia bacterium]